MPHHTTLVQRCRATNSLLADELQREFSRLENDRADAADEIEQLKSDADAMAQRIQAGDRSRDEVIEECALLAANHAPPALRKGIDPEVMEIITAERRGEIIAADEIAIRLRRLKTKPLS